MARLRSIIITNGGTGYSSAPTVSFSGASGQTVAPAATATIFGGSVTNITIDNPGAFTTNGPTTVTLSGGGGTGATAVPFNEETRPSLMMAWDVTDVVFNITPANVPRLAGISGHRELDTPWRDSYGTLQLNTTAVPARPGPTIVPGISGS